MKKFFLFFFLTSLVVASVIASPTRTVEVNVSARASLRLNQYDSTRISITHARVVY